MHYNEKVFQLVMAMIVFLMPLLIIVYFYTKIQMVSTESRRFIGDRYNGTKSNHRKLNLILGSLIYLQSVVFYDLHRANGFMALLTFQVVLYCPSWLHSDQMKCIMY